MVISSGFSASLAGAPHSIQPLILGLTMKKTLLFACLAVVLIGGAVAAQLQRQKSVEGTTVYFVAPANGATVSSPFTVKFGLKGMGVAPAGVNHPNTGHHHLLIDVDKLPDFSAPLPATDNIRHFGGGQTEAELTLPPGRHTLQLVFADYLHIPHDSPVVSEKITITVK
jgi:hypothetical protein